jgi:hypothetical protein
MNVRLLLLLALVTVVSTTVAGCTKSETPPPGTPSGDENWRKTPPTDANQPARH